MRRRSKVIAAVLCLAGAIGAQPPDTFDLWLQDRIDTAVGKARIGINGKSVSRQTSSPTTVDRSTSLVDQSSATDFVSTALSIAPITNTSATAPSGSGSSGAGTVTATLYSLLAGFNHTSISDPKFYAAHTAARQVSFTAGTVQSDPTADNSSKPGTVVGIKVTPVNGRELYSRNGQLAIADVQKALTAKARAYTPLATKVRNLIFFACQPDGICRKGKVDNLDTPSEMTEVRAFAAFWNKYQVNMRGLRLTQDNLDQIDQLVLTSISAFTEYQTIVEKSYDRIHQGAQLALAYSGVLRSAPGYDHHKASVIYDYGLSDSITWTFNGAGDYIDRKSLPAIRGGTVATQFLGRLTGESSDPNGRRAMTLAFSGQAKWLTQTKPQYTVQSTLTIPLAAGIEVPVAFQWANRKLLLDHSGPELHVGLNVDVARVTAMFK